MPKQSEYVTYLLELLALLGQVTSRAMFGGQPFSYSKKDGTVAVMSYWTVPADLLEDQEPLLVWARKARDTALKHKAPPKRSKKTKP